MAMTGHDMAEWFRGRYKTRREALALIKQRTGHTGVAAIAEYAANEHGLESIPVNMARRGDMVLVGTGSKALLGVMSLNGADVMCLGKQGIMRVALSHATAAWRV
jgi:hypothetical protein